VWEKVEGKNKCCRCKWQGKCEETLYYKTPINLRIPWLIQGEIVRLSLLCNLVVGPNYYPNYISPEALGKC
jgi:hypothetical protein